MSEYLAYLCGFTWQYAFYARLLRAVFKERPGGSACNTAVALTGALLRMIPDKALRYEEDRGFPSLERESEIGIAGEVTEGEVAAV